MLHQVKHDAHAVKGRIITTIDKCGVLSFREILNCGLAAMQMMQMSGQYGSFIMWKALTIARIETNFRR
jgi:hypothetical protein